MVQRHAVGHPGPPVMPHDVEAFKAQGPHHLDLVLRHSPLGVVAVVRQPLRLSAVPVAPQVGGHHCEALRQLGRHLVPHQTGLRVPVEEEERLPLPHPDPVDFHTVGLDVEFLSLHPHRSLHPFLYIEHSAQF